ncbi:hypothetical protein GQ457_08G016890 [Hibiscus cannabinus]
MSLQDHQTFSTDTQGAVPVPKVLYPKPSTDTPYVVFQQADSSEQFEYRYSKGVSIPRAGTDTLRMGTDTLEQRSATTSFFKGGTDTLKPGTDTHFLEWQNWLEKIPNGSKQGPTVTNG